MQNGKQLFLGTIGNEVKRGFTLIELLVVLSILALLLTIATPQYFSGENRAREATLKQDLHVMREAIDKFYADKGLYPESLEQLVESEYINKVPVDPITKSNETWALIEPEPPAEGDVYDVKSGAEGSAKDGTNYADW